MTESRPVSTPVKVAETKRKLKPELFHETVSSWTDEYFTNELGQNFLKNEKEKH